MEDNGAKMYSCSSCKVFKTDNLDILKKHERTHGLHFIKTCSGVNQRPASSSPSTSQGDAAPSKWSDLCLCCGFFPLSIQLENIFIVWLFCCWSLWCFGTRPYLWYLMNLSIDDYWIMYVCQLCVANIHRKHRYKQWLEILCLKIGNIANTGSFKTFFSHLICESSVVHLWSCKLWILRWYLCWSVCSFLSTWNEINDVLRSWLFCQSCCSVGRTPFFTVD